MDGTRRAGVVLRVGDSYKFIPATVALRVALAPRVTPIPGAPACLLGIALQGGSIMGVVSIGEARAEMVVCHFAGELLGIVGGHVIQTGLFEASPEGDAVDVGGVPAHTLDLADLVRRMQSEPRSSSYPRSG